MRVPNTFVIIFFLLLLCAVATWFVPGGVPQTWQVLSALFEGFSQQSEIIAFVLIIGGAFWIVNNTKAVDVGISKFITKARRLEKFALVRFLGVGNIVIVLVMLLFGIFGAVFGMCEETIAFVAVVIPLARSLGYDEFTGVFMVYMAALVGFAGAMLNPFTIGIAQKMADLPLFSGVEYRTFCWVVIMLVSIIWVLWYASRHRKDPSEQESVEIESTVTPSGKATYAVFALILTALAVFTVFYSSECTINIGQSSFHLPWLLPVADAFFVLTSVFALRNSRQMFVLNLLMFTVVYMVIGVMGYGWYLTEICALFLALGICAGVAAGFSADKVAQEFVAGAKDIFSAALIIGFAAGIIVILENGNVIEPMLQSMASMMGDEGKAEALGLMYGIQTFINVFVPSASAKAAATIPVMAPFADMIGLSRQATVLAFQFGDGFTNMITPCSGVLMAVLSVAKIPFGLWVKRVWKFILFLMILGFLLLLPTVYLTLPGF